MENIKWSEGSFDNSRGRKIYTQQWIPANPRAIIVLIHGYGDHSHWLIKECSERMAQDGIAAFAFDQEGHGKSEGLQAYVESFDALAEDSIKYVEYAKGIFPNLKCFLHGGSMGGAIVLLTALKRPELISGIILVSPMIKVADSAKPNWVVVEALKGLCRFFPTWAIVPNVDIVDLAFRNEKDRIVARSNPLNYSGKVRLGTGLAILNITDYIQANLDKVSVPLLVQHGTGDLVTSHESSIDLFEKSVSKDKTLVLYDKLWHVMPFEPMSAKVDSDAKEWLHSRIETDHICEKRELVEFVDSSIVENVGNVGNVEKVESIGSDSISPQQPEIVAQE